VEEVCLERPPLSKAKAFARRAAKTQSNNANLLIDVATSFLSGFSFRGGQREKKEVFITYGTQGSKQQRVETSFIEIMCSWWLQHVQSIGMQYS